MYIHCSLLFVVLTISGSARVSGYTNSLNNSPLGQLTKTCPSDGIPVCGVRDKQLILFSNECLLNEVNKDILQGEAIFRKIALHHCIYECQLSCSKVYEPVCAQNVATSQKQLFRNQCELTQHVCKSYADYLIIGLSQCLPKTYLKNSSKLLDKRSEAEKKRVPIPCTNVFKPVCGSYMGVKSSFKNECLLNAENIMFNRDWRIVNEGVCPQDYSKNRRHKAMPTQTHSITKRSFQNNFYNVYHDDNEYNTNNFVENKNELDAPANDLYVYMPQTYNTQYVSPEPSNYQQSTPEHDAYEDFLNKIVTFPPINDIPILEEEKTKQIEQPLLEKSNIKPLPFAINRMNFNYLSDQPLIDDINRQSISPVINSLIGEGKEEYNYEFERFNSNGKSEDINEMPAAIMTSSETTSSNINTSTTTTKPPVYNEQKKLKKEDIAKKNNECKFGSVAICAALANGTVRTFETVCKMMTTNIHVKNTWTKLHDGVCDNCKYNCSRDYKPVCVTRNGVNYTMVNECYYNMAICIDKISKWQILSNAECERYTRIPDKYANVKPGFPYTSNYFVSETTAMSITESLPATIPDESSKIKSNISKKRISNSENAISRSRRLSSEKCCSHSNNSDQISDDGVKCECWNDSTLASSTESYIMRLVKDTDTPE